MKEGRKEGRYLAARGRIRQPHVAYFVRARIGVAHGYIVRPLTPKWESDGIHIGEGGLEGRVPLKRGMEGGRGTLVAKGRRGGRAGGAGRKEAKEGSERKV
jgi:hypothetical protein